jgi:uncharacterized protein (DUF1499 family)
MEHAMSNATLSRGSTRSLGGSAAWVGFWLAILALALLAAGPLAWRTGLLHYRVGLFYLMPMAAFAAAGAAIVSLVSLGAWRTLGARGRALAAAGLVLGAAASFLPFQANLLRATLPPIHDISTDTANPPSFASTLAARKMENGNSVEYTPEVAKQQRAAYPDIAPATTPLPPPEAFERAIAAAESMPGWTIVSRNAANGRIEASEPSLFYAFTDDVVIRVAPDGAGSRIDMRSESRQGRSDFGVNAARVRRYMAALKRKLGTGF